MSYTCTTIGSGTTRWILESVEPFNLRHSGFVDGVEQSSLDGQVTARSQSVEECLDTTSGTMVNTCYTSVLTIRLSSLSIIGSTVKCCTVFLYDARNIVTVFGNTTITNG